MVCMFSSIERALDSFYYPGSRPANKKRFTSHTKRQIYVTSMVYTQKLQKIRKIALRNIWILEDWCLKLYFVILLGRFPLVRKIKKIFGHFFHIIAVQKVISRHIFRRRGAEGPETSKNVSRNHFLNQDKMWKWSNFSKFLLNKCMKTIQVMQQTIFFYFGIDLRTTFQSPTFKMAYLPLAPCSRGTRRVPSAVGGWACQGLSEEEFIQNGCRRQPFWKNSKQLSFSYLVSKFHQDRMKIERMTAILSLNWFSLEPSWKQVEKIFFRQTY